MANLEVAGCSLHFTEQGRGTPIVFIHGTGANADVWGDLLHNLAARHRVIAYDRRGFSRSRSEALPDWQAHYSEAIALLQRLGAHPAVLVGWSSGGPIALEVARIHPELVRSLILLEPAMPLLATLTPSGLSMMLRGKAIQLTRGDRSAAEWFYRWATAYREGGSGFDRMEPEMREAQPDNAKASMNEIQSGRRGAGHLGARTLRGIPTPAFCALGEESAHGWYRRTTEFVARNLPNGVVRTIPGAAHAAFRDQPAAFASIVEEATALGGQPLRRQG